MSKRFKKLGGYVTCIFILIVLLSSCSLAKEELQDLKSGDKLIGVFVTLEEDLKDYEMQEGDTLYYQEKKLVRADGSVEKLTDKEIHGLDNGFTVEGKKQRNGCYTFDDIDGYYMGYTEKRFEMDGETYSDIESHFSDGIYDTITSSESNSIEGENNANEEVFSLKGTIGISIKQEKRIRINTVYKRDDGSVYAIIPSAGVMVINSNSTSGILTREVSESYAADITGTGIESKTINKTTSKFAVSIEQVDFLENAFIRQMDKNHELISLTEVDLLKKNQEIQLDKKTDYVIIEEHFMDKNGDFYNKRTAYDCAQIGEISKDGHEEFVSHDFHITKNNGKTDLITLSMQR